MANDEYWLVWIDWPLDRAADACPPMLMEGDWVEADLVVRPQNIDMCNDLGRPHLLRDTFIFYDGQAFMLQPNGVIGTTHMIFGQFRYWIEGDLPQVPEEEILTKTPV